MRISLNGIFMLNYKMKGPEHYLIELSMILYQSNFVRLYI
jgi:hypothetical protein